MAATDSTNGSDGSGSDGDGGADYSGTNIQVEGVDEADIVKIDGEYIYLASDDGIVIAKIYPPNQAELITTIKLEENINGLFINDDKLVVFSTYYPRYYLDTPDGSTGTTDSDIQEDGDREDTNSTSSGDTVEGTDVDSEDSMIYPGYSTDKTSIKVYNIENRASPILARNVTFDGYYFDSRMIGDYVYAIISQPAYLYDENVTLPRVETDGMYENIKATQIYYTNVTDWSYSYTIIASVNTQNDNESISHETFLLGYTSNLYVSLENIYLAIPDYSGETQTTVIHRLHIENGQIIHEASGSVPGYVLNQFSMSQQEEYFRIATTKNDVNVLTGESTTLNNVYVLDLDLNIVGRLEGLAPGESIYAARFIGNRCYLVTFVQIDPLFVISLEDPENPIVLGELKIPGYSDYLHPYDENHLIGIGKNTTLIKQDDREIALYQGVKISLFDVSDVANPIEVDNYIIGDRGTESPVLYNHKALLFSKTKNLLAIPALVAEINENQYQNEKSLWNYGEYVYQGLFVFDITDEEITLRGQTTHMKDENNFLEYDYSYDYFIERSFYIENVLYSISQKKIQMNNINDLTISGELNIP